MFNNLTPPAGGQPDPNAFKASPASPAPAVPGATPPARSMNEAFNSKPEDIFHNIQDSAAKPQEFQPKNQVSVMNDYDGSAAGHDDKLKKYFALTVMALLLILIISGGVIAYNRIFNRKITADEPAAAIADPEAQKQESAELKNDEEADSQPNQPDEDLQTEPIANQPEPTAAPSADSDQDSLNDDEEKELKTDPNSTDTDNDGLFDREEAKAYKTDPLNADTDGDGFLDGEEVKGGYNPLGPGKLYEIK